MGRVFGQLGRFYPWMSLDYILDKMNVRQMCLYYDYMVEYTTGKPMGLGFDEPDLESLHQAYGPGQVIKR